MADDDKTPPNLYSINGGKKPSAGFDFDLLDGMDDASKQMITALISQVENGGNAQTLKFYAESVKHLLDAAESARAIGDTELMTALVNKARGYIVKI